MRVLIVVDDAAVCRIVRDQLETRGVGIVSAGSVEASREALARTDFQAIILDPALPDGSGLELLAELRASGSGAHVIVLSGAGSEADRVHAIEQGADDYVVKPFSARELAARVLAVERRRSLTEDTTLRIGPLEIDLKAREVTADDRLIDLTTKEFALLAFLAARPGHTFSRAELLRAVWQSSPDWQQSATVTEHVRRLRTKVEPDPRRPQMLKTVRGAGYRLDVPSPGTCDAGKQDAQLLGAGAVIHVKGRIVAADAAAVDILGAGGGSRPPGQGPVGLGQDRRGSGPPTPSRVHLVPDRRPMNQVLVDEVEEFLDLAAAGRPRPAIAQALRLLDAGYNVEDLIVGLLAPAQREVGLRWQAHRWNTAQEHAATSVIDGVLGAVALHTPVPSPARGAVLVSCVEEEHHSVPARMGVERLRADGWDVTFLGASVPARDLQAFAASTQVDAAVLSCTLPLFLPGATRAIAALADLGVPAVAAGAGFGDTPRRAAQLGASGWIGPVSNPTAVLAGLPAAVTGVSRQREEEAVQLELHADELRESAMDEMSRGIPAMSAYSSRQLARTREDLSYMLRYLGLALDLDEPSMFEDFVAWLSEVLAARGVPGGVLDASLEIVAEVARSSGLVRAARVCTSGRLVLAGA